MATTSVYKEKVYPDNYPAEVVDVIELFSFSKANVVGSASLRSQMNAGDYDMGEDVSVKSVGEFVKGFTEIVKNIYLTKGLYLGDIKCGRIVEWEVISPDAQVKDGKVVGYNSTDSKRKLDELKEKKIISADEYKEAYALLGSTPEDFLTAKKEIKFDTVRWTYNDVMAGFTILRDGRKFELEEAIQTPGLCKVDAVGWVENKRYSEFSCIYNVKVNGKVVNPVKEDLFQSLKNDMLYYYSQGKYFKYAKRLFAYAKAKKDEKLGDELSEFLNSDLGRIYQMSGDMDTLLWLVENASRLDAERIHYEIAGFKVRLGSVYSIRALEKYEPKLLGTLKSLEKMPPKGSAFERDLERVKDMINEALNSESKRQLEAMGLAPIPKLYGAAIADKPKRTEAVFLSDDFYAAKDGYQRITVRGTNNSTMGELVRKINSAQSASGLASQSGLKYVYDNRKDDSELLEGCEWYNMPAYPAPTAWNKIPSLFLFVSKTSPSAKTFVKKMDERGIKITENSTSIWYPDRPVKELSAHLGEMWNGSKVSPKYPIYIISKGRWEKRLTSRYLEWADIPYKIVVEQQEFDNYAAVIDKSKILILPKTYQKKNAGGIPARNFVMDHAKKSGAKRHWILDDNIQGYYRLYKGERNLVKSGAVFRACEDYCDRYKNVMLAGHNYTMFGFAPNLKPITRNTRVYSSILINNDIPYHWRGRYNEDTDLSLRVLKAGYPTLLFNCFLANKLMTLTQKGGNTDSIYSVKNALYLKAKSLADQHPDVAEVKKRFGRIHHWVNYSPFKDLMPEFKPGVRAKLTTAANNYSLRLVKLDKEARRDIWKDPKESDKAEEVGEGKPNDCRQMDMDSLQAFAEDMGWID